jgi:small GTP-binding protein
MTVENELSPGLKLVQVLEGHEDNIRSLTFNHRGELLASGDDDGVVNLWDVRSGKLLCTFEGHNHTISCLAFNPRYESLASGSVDGAVKLWDVRTGKLLRTFEGHDNLVRSVTFDPLGYTVATASDDKTVKLWNSGSGRLLRTFERHVAVVTNASFNAQGDTLGSGSTDGTVNLWRKHSGELLLTLEDDQGVCSLAFHPQMDTLATGSLDNSIKVWTTDSHKLLRTLEGHITPVFTLIFSSDGRLLFSKSDDYIRLWNCETWETVAGIPILTRGGWCPAMALNPTLPLLAASNSSPDTPEIERGRLIHVWELDYDVLLGKRTAESATTRAVHHTTGKIVIVGDHSVGKSALAHRLIYGEFKEQASTHGQQFWVFPAVSKQRNDGTECEAILWDFAGQPDYRLVHTLFVDNADLALVLFDAADIHDPLHGVGFWLKQLRRGQSRCPIILVAAQIDRGTSPLTEDELSGFCQHHGITGPIKTSALTGRGIDELIEGMQSLIPWDDKATTVTTITFKRIKDYVLGLKQTESQQRTIVTPWELRERLQASDSEWQFTDDEMLTAVGHLENYGYVKRLRTSKGEVRIILQPERLNNLASSFVLEARRNPKGLGALEEKRLLAGDYDFPEVRDLHRAERDVLLDSATLLFLEHNVCFRETDPLRMEPYLVFPELINLKKPLEKDTGTEDGVAYTVNGPTENVFASLVVLLGYTHTFTRTQQWHNNARYEVGEELVCGFRQEAERDGELNFVLCFAPNVGQPVRTLFQGLFESFLARRNLTVQRYEPVRCSKNHLLNRAVIREAMQQGDVTAFCSKCGEKLMLPAMAEPIQLTRAVQVEVETQRRIAEQRTRFEQAVFRLNAYIEQQEMTPPECFISYAWGDPADERWVEKRLATDLQKAGIEVVLDRWHNAQIGASVARFIEQIEKSDRIIMVGTPAYRRKYENQETDTGYVVAAEVDLINYRLLGTEAHKSSVLPLLLSGEQTTALPPLLHGRVYADFRNDESYFMTAFDLILSLYNLPPTHPAVADLRESLLPPGFAFRN